MWFSLCVDFLINFCVLHLLHTPSTIWGWDKLSNCLPSFGPCSKCWPRKKGEENSLFSFFSFPRSPRRSVLFLICRLKGIPGIIKLSREKQGQSIPLSSAHYLKYTNVSHLTEHKNYLKNLLTCRVTGLISRSSDSRAREFALLRSAQGCWRLVCTVLRHTHNLV